MTALLDIEDLRIAWPGPHGPVEGVRGATLSMGRERLGVVGESGSGKSSIGRAVLGLVARPGVVTAKRLAFDGIDLLGLPPAGFRALRGRRIGLILQDPRHSLNPVMRVGEQIAEVWRGASRAEARRRAMAMLEAVRIDDPERVYRLYPHQISGGMGQRVMIAMMLAPEPDLLIADEPTSALDAALRAQVLGLMDELCARRGTGLLLISHDLPMVAGFCDRVAVMYAGRVVETLPAADLPRAAHPYTRGLLACLPRPDLIGGPLPTLIRDPAWAEPP
ncbi:MAG: ABC transporter ATP-binding protein [Alphaproteobacteria bacterium]|nr:ABC transporter ATP-binding protein [Alphaproteobacteria bacterium]